MKKWECLVCGYVHEGEEPPDKCPVCGAEKKLFKEITDAAESSGPSDRVMDAQVSDEAEQAPLEDSSQGAATMFGKLSELVLGNHLHPIAVHTPNGIVPMAVIFFVLAVLFKSLSFENAAYYSLIFVFLGMPLVLLTGYVTWQKKYQGVTTALFKTKIAAGSVATVILLVLIVWRTMQPDILSPASSGRWIFLTLSMFLLGLVGLAGHLGGKLVFAGK